MNALLTAILPTLGMLVGMFLCLEVGRRLGARQRGRGEEPGASAIDGAVFALFGLIVAFTFSGASSRFDDRRGQIVVECNAIGTAWLRLDLLPSDAQAALRPLFREYLQARIATHRALPDLDLARAELDRSNRLQGEIWARAVPAAVATGNPATQQLVVSSLNDAFDTATTRLATARYHVPWVIVGLLFGLAFAAALVVGYSSAPADRRQWLRPVLFTLAIAATIYVTLDLEFPRLGLIRLHDADQPMIELLGQLR
jgi:hypothetical protein